MAARMIRSRFAPLLVAFLLAACSGERNVTLAVQADEGRCLARIAGRHFILPEEREMFSGFVRELHLRRDELMVEMPRGPLGRQCTNSAVFLASEMLNG